MIRYATIYTIQDGQQPRTSEVCGDWHSGQGCPLYALASSGSYGARVDIGDSEDLFGAFYPLYRAVTQALLVARQQRSSDVPVLAHLQASVSLWCKSATGEACDSDLPHPDSLYDAAGF